jgi:hypothetical protein
MSTSVLTDSVVMRPVRRWWLRMLIFLAVAAFPLLSRADLHKKVIFAATMAAWLGSYPLSRIRGEQFERLMFVVFMPVRTKRWSLERFVSIQPEAEPGDELGGAWWWIFGNWYIMWIVFDWMIPWVGGPIKLWLRASSGKRVLAWQGRSDSQFRENMDLLQHRLGLPIEA